MASLQYNETGPFSTITLGHYAFARASTEPDELRNRTTALARLTRGQASREGKEGLSLPVSLFYWPFVRLVATNCGADADFGVDRPYPLAPAR